MVNTYLPIMMNTEKHPFQDSSGKIITPVGTDATMISDTMVDQGIDDLLSFDHGFKREGRINVIGI